MNHFLPSIDKTVLQEALAADEGQKLYELLVEPLHEELYRRQDFSFLDELSEGQQLLLSYDYLRTQVQGGGFIQLLHNGYAPLLLPMPSLLQMAGAPDTAQLLDDVLKLYVAHREQLEEELSVEEFAKLYNELTVFEALDARFGELNESTVDTLLRYAKEHLEQFVAADL